MLDTQIPIVRLASPHAHKAAEAVARAFQDDPLMVYMMPDPVRRQPQLVWLFSRGIRYCSLYGENYSTGDAHGAAMWLTPDNTTMSFGRLARSGFLAFPLKLGFSAVGRFMSVIECTEQAHKSAVSGPHWYLNTLGVDPAYQGRGIGSALLGPALARADHDHLPCYLETANEQNLPFYERHGFAVAHAGKVPKGGPSFWAMVRQPRAI